jgi:CRP-like cAMP-binding protein
MIAPEMLRRLAFFAGLSDRALKPIADQAEIRAFSNNEVVAAQHDRAIAVYFLVSGTVQFLIRVEGHDDLLVALGSEPGLIIGWAAFRPPYRHTSSARCEQDCRFLRVPHDAFDEILEQDAESGLTIMRRIAENLARRLDLEQAQLSEGDDHRKFARIGAVSDAMPREVRDESEAVDLDLTTTRGIAELLRNTQFFGDMEERFLAWLADQAYVMRAAPGDILFRKERVASHLYVIVEGRVGLTGEVADDRRTGALRTLTGLGEPFGWSALVDPRRYRETCVIVEPTLLLALPSPPLERLCEEEPRFGIALFRRVIQLIGSRLRATRVGLVARRYAEETLAVRALLDQSAETLHVSSALHKIPYLLENRLTLSDAFNVLELTKAHGDPVERHLANESLDILEGVHRELDFYRGLQAVYETVANAPADLTAEDVRKWSMEVCAHLFRQTSYRIRGEENLPDRAGNLVVMNHLENHPDTLLPNQFRLTLDSHFVSSMILYPHYGEAPIRVVRKPMLGWYGFQQYFDRLDYIYVYGGDLDEEDRDRRISHDDRIRAFVDRAAAHLQAGRNLVIAPEGECRYTEDSPGPFRAGAFRLAASVKPEPLIVPIAVANFDKKITQTTTAAVIFPSFRLSDELADPGDEEALRAFVDRFQERFRGYVRRAVALAAAR